eukprot:6952977-Pyramimonas_sp.AAC.1
MPRLRAKSMCGIPRLANGPWFRPDRLNKHCWCSGIRHAQFVSNFRGPAWWGGGNGCDGPPPFRCLAYS